MWKYPGIGRLAKAALSLLLVLLLLLVLAMAACPALHHAIHRDSDCADHQCTVTMFASGQVIGVELAPFIAFVVVFLIYAVSRPIVAPRLIFANLSAPSRAPPR